MPQRGVSSIEECALKCDPEQLCRGSVWYEPLRTCYLTGRDSATKPFPGYLLIANEIDPTEGADCSQIEEELKARLIAKNQTIATLQGEKEECGLDLTAKTQTVTRLESEKAQCESNLLTKREKLSTLQGEKDECTMKLDTKRKKIDALEKEMVNLRSELEDMKSGKTSGIKLCANGPNNRGEWNLQVQAHKGVEALPKGLRLMKFEI